MLNALYAGITGVTGQATVLTIGNPDLEPETSTRSEIGAHYDNHEWFQRLARRCSTTSYEEKIASGNDILIENDPLIPDCLYGQDIQY